jgi:hypothetical protein
MVDLTSSRWLNRCQDGLDRRLMRHRPPHIEMVASTVRVELNRSDLCKHIRSCSIIWVLGSAVTKCASGVLSGIFVHQDYRAVLLRKELSRIESNVCLAPHDTNHLGGRRRRVGLATAIATRATRVAPKTRPLSSLRDIGRFRPT